MFRQLVTALSITLLILLQNLEGELSLAPGCLAPPNLDYAGYHKYIDEMLPSEIPVLYGLHPNAEMGYLTTSDYVFKTILEMQPMNSFIGEGSGQSTEEKVKFFIWCTVVNINAVNDMWSTHLTVLFQEET